jgi:hypothetical protein
LQFYQSDDFFGRIGRRPAMQVAWDAKRVSQSAIAQRRERRGPDGGMQCGFYERAPWAPADAQ